MDLTMGSNIIKTPWDTNMFPSISDKSGICIMASQPYSPQPSRLGQQTLHKALLGDRNGHFEAYETIYKSSTNQLLSLGGWRKLCVT